MKETTGLLPNILSSSYQRMNEASVGASSDQAQIEICQNRLLVSDMENKNENIKDETNTSQPDMEIGTRSDVRSKNSIEIVKAIMEDTLVPKIIPSKKEISKTSDAIVKDIVDDVLVKQVLLNDNKKESNSQNLHYLSTQKTNIKNSDENHMLPKCSNADSVDYSQDNVTTACFPNTQVPFQSRTENKKSNTTKSNNADKENSLKLVNDETAMSKDEQLSDANILVKEVLEVVDISSGEEDKYSENSSNEGNDDETGALEIPIQVSAKILKGGGFRGICTLHYKQKIL